MKKIGIFLLTEEQYKKLILSLHPWNKQLPKKNQYKITNLFDDNKGNIISLHLNKQKIRKANIRSKENSIYNNEIKMFKIFHSVLKQPSLDNFNIIGSDEVGKSDYFGPIVICAIYIKEKNKIGELLNDSKKMGYQKAKSVELKTHHYTKMSSIIINPLKMKEMNLINNFNLNHILYYFHLVLTSKFAKQIMSNSPKKTQIIIDDFTNNNSEIRQKYDNQIKSLMDKNILNSLENLDIAFILKADNLYLENKLASIYAKNIFLNEMIQVLKTINRFEPTINQKEIFGNSNKTANIIHSLKSKMPSSELKKIIKPLYWKKFTLN